MQLLSTPVTKRLWILMLLNIGVNFSVQELEIEMLLASKLPTICQVSMQMASLILSLSIPKTCLVPDICLRLKGNLCQKILRETQNKTTMFLQLLKTKINLASTSLNLT